MENTDPVIIDSNNKKSNTKTIIIVVIATLLVTLLGCGIVLFMYLKSIENYKNNRVMDRNPLPITTPREVQIEEDIIKNEDIKKPVENNKITTAKSIPGLWHAMPNLGSGYAEVYQFFDDGTFIFNYNQMDCAKRTISFSGTWNEGKGQIILTKTERTDWEGGTLVESMGSCGTPMELIDATLKTTKISPAEAVTLKISEMREGDEDDIYQTVMEIDGETYWKQSDNPEDYNY